MPLLSDTVSKLMGRRVSFHSSAQSAGGRNNKTMLLPLPRAKADELGLRNHIALALMRSGKGSMSTAQTLLEAIVLTGFLAEAGYGQFEPARWTEAEKAVCDAIDRGNETEHWSLDLIDVGKLEEIVTLYDQQLRDAPLSAVAEAGERLTRFKAGQPFGLARKRRP
jgi:hypothetical protein